MGCDFRGTVCIPWEEVNELLKKHNPALAGGGEWETGPVRGGLDGIEIFVSYSDYCHPRALKEEKSSKEQES